MAVSGAAPLSVCVITHNEEENLPRCLESVRELASQIVVVDSGSSDRTVQIAREAGAEVYEQPFMGYVLQKEIALRKATAKWILCVDADEWIDHELRSAIRRVLANGASGDICGYWVNRRTFYQGRWIDSSGWSAEWKIRMVRKGKGRWTGIDPHDRLEVAGETARFSGRLCHFPYKNFAAHLNKIDRYTAISAGIHVANGGGPSLLRMYAEPVLKFFRMYVAGLGVREGFQGAALAGMGAFYVFLKQLRVWEARHTRGSINNPHQEP